MTDSETQSRFARDTVNSPRWCHLTVSYDSAFLSALFEPLGLVARHVRGKNMRTSAEMRDEFAEAWRFNEYHGSSPGGFFRDSLLDLTDAWPTKAGFVVVISEPWEVLVDEISEYPAFNPLSGLENTLANVAENFAESVAGEPGDPDARDPLAFKVILATDEAHREETERRWTEAGAPLTD